MSKEKVEINGEIYIKQEEGTKDNFENQDFCIIRTYSAGVFMGYIESRVGKEAVIRKSRRIWYWDGACSLSELAVKGTSCPENCKFAMEVDKEILTEVIEILYCTKEAEENLKGVYVWQK